MRVEEHAGLERIEELEAVEAGIEGDLAKLLERQRRRPDDTIVEQIAALQQEHLATRRELNDLRARQVPLAGIAAR